MTKPAFALAMCIAAVVASAASQANEAHRQLSQLSTADRNTLLTSFMKQSGERCRVTKSFFQGTTKTNDAFWNVACAEGKSFSIMIINDAEGSTKVTDCAVMKAIAKVECFKKF